MPTAKKADSRWAKYVGHQVYYSLIGSARRMHAALARHAQLSRLSGPPQPGMANKKGQPQKRERDVRNV